MICLGDHITVTPEESSTMYDDYLAFVGKQNLGTCSGRGWDYPEAIKQACLQPTDIVLDIGCASSYFGLYIARWVKQSYGIDDIGSYAYEEWTSAWLPTLLDFEEYHNGSFALVFGNAAKLPFPDNFFDQVFTVSALEHFVDDDDTKSAVEVARVLKPGGSFLGTVDYNPLSEYPHALPDRCYTYESFIRRVVTPSGLMLDGRDYLKDTEIPETADDIMMLFFHLRKQQEDKAWV